MNSQILNKVINIITISFFIFSLSKLINLVSGTGSILNILFYGIIYSTIIPFFFSKNKEYITISFYIITYLISIVLNLILHYIYSDIFLLYEFNFKYQLLVSFFSIIPGSIIYFIYSISKKYIIKDNE